MTDITITLDREVGAMELTLPQGSTEKVVFGNIELKIKGGNVFSLTVPRNGSTGHVQTVEMKNLEVIADRFVPPSSGNFGAGGKHVYEFRLAAEKVTGSFFARNHRPSDDPKTGINVVGLNISVG